MNASLVESLEDHTANPWVEIVRPEILSLGTVRGGPVVARAADLAAFLSLERGAWVQAATVGDRRAVAGEGLVRRLGLVVGDDVTVVGSSVPRIAFVRIVGIYRTATPANDELLVDFAIGRLLSGLSGTGFHSIRIRTTGPTAHLDFLRGFGESVHVTGPYMTRDDSE